mmetsp:Transcript_44515/g.121329  ORF Transcript_44515/g.121329 Transcript_44515/m.121329 type:complete len:198 (+) Transcript_44515:120-713(+)
MAARAALIAVASLAGTSAFSLRPAGRPPLPSNPSLHGTARVHRPHAPHRKTGAGAGGLRMAATSTNIALTEPSRRFQAETCQKVLSEPAFADSFVPFKYGDTVLDVSNAIVGRGQGCVALVFSDDDTELLGIFTGRDYQKVTEKYDCPPEDEDCKEQSTAKRFVSGVGEWMTPASIIIAATPDTTADQALDLMRQVG